MSYLTDFLMLLAILCLLPHFVIILLAKCLTTGKPKLGDHSTRPLVESRSITVLVPVRDEPFEIVQRTLTACRRFVSEKPKTELVLVDNSRRSIISALYKELVTELGFSYLNVGVCQNKAEALNKALRHIDTEFFLVLDSDQQPVADFLSILIRNIVESDKIALVQTPQRFISKNALQDSIACHESLFYKLIMPFRDLFGAAICVGTNFIARTDVVKHVGGFSVNTITEDIDLSWKLVLNGYSVSYLQIPLFIGMPPVDFQTYLSQRKRYASGAISLLQTLFSSPTLLKSSASKKMLLIWLLYLQAATWYLTGFAMLGLLVIQLFTLFTFVSPSSFSLFGKNILFAMLILSTWILSKQSNLKQAIIAQIIAIPASFYFCLGIGEAILGFASFTPTRKFGQKGNFLLPVSLSGLIGFVLLILWCIDFGQKSAIPYIQRFNISFHLFVSGIIYLFPDILEWNNRFRQKNQ